MSRIHRLSLYATTAIGLGLVAPAFGATISDGGSADHRQTTPASNEGVQQIEEITVTARRISERLQDVPISITVFNQQQLNNRNVTNASDLASYTPSLSADKRFGPDNSSFAIRGFTQEIRTAASVAVYFADVVAPRGGGIGTTAGDGAGPGSYFDLQNVQVLKGPQGTLFGRNTTGGAVLLVPNKPSDEFEGYIEGSYGNYGMQRVQGVLNAPLSDDVRLRVGFDEETRGGYENNISGIGPSHLSNVNYYAFRASLVMDATPNLENYTIASFSRSDNYGTLNQIFACNPSGGSLPFYALLDTLGGVGPCGQVKKMEGHDYWTVDNAMPDPQSLNEQWQLINATTWHVSDALTIKNIASYAQFKSDLDESVFGDNFSVPGTLPSTVTLDFAGTTITLPTGGAAASALLKGTQFYVANSHVAPGSNSNDQSTLTEELQFQGNGLDNKLIWQGGGYVEISDPIAPVKLNSSVNASCTNLNSAPAPCYNTFGLLVPTLGDFITLGGDTAGLGGTISYHNLAGYGQATYSITDELKLTGGIRYTSDLTKGMSSIIVYNFPPTPANPTLPPPNTPVESCAGAPAATLPNCQLFSRQHSHAPTWLVDLDYTPVENVMMYVKYSRGYRQGSVDPFGPSGFQTFRPERVDAYEVGAKTSFEGPVPGSFDFAAFYNDFTNQQLQAGFTNTNIAEALLMTNLGAPPTTGIINAGKSRIEGVEVESSLFPFGESFRLDFSGTYLSTKLISEASVTLPPGSPYNEVLFTTAVGGPLPLTPKFKTSVTGTYTLPVPESLGKISVGANYVYTGREITSSPANTPFPYVSASNVINLFANWDSINGSPCSASFFMTNAMDAKTENFITGIYNGYGFESRSIGEPRMWGLRLRYDFGG